MDYAQFHRLQNEVRGCLFIRVFVASSISVKRFQCLLGQGMQDQALKPIVMLVSVRPAVSVSELEAN
jgi:hypothetical protein